MSVKKEFNKWIAKRFKGLSPHTLFQLIEKEFMLPKEYISNMIYVDLFHVFINSATEKETGTYMIVKHTVDNYNWL